MKFYALFVPVDLKPNQVAYVKIIATEKPHNNKVKDQKSDSLAVEGISANNEVVFRYKNAQQGIS
jgi:hypothetical protein